MQRLMNVFFFAMIAEGISACLKKNFLIEAEDPQLGSGGKREHKTRQIVLNSEYRFVPDLRPPPNYRPPLFFEWK